MSTTPMADVFMSYAREDAATAKVLADYIHANGWVVWWDQELRAGLDYEQVIDRVVRRASAVVVLWSRHSVESRWVRAEASAGWERSVMVPVRLDESRPPVPFSNVHAVDLTTWSGQAGDPEILALLTAVRSLVQSQGGPWAPPAPAGPQPPPPPRVDRQAVSASGEAASERGSTRAGRRRSGRNRWVVAGALLAVALLAVAAIGFLAWPARDGDALTSDCGPELRDPCHGSAVEALQSMLQAAGYLPSDPDGAFGSETEAALRLFEAEHRTTTGVTLNGQVTTQGQEWNALDALDEDVAQVRLTGDLCGPVVVRGCTGPAAAKVEALLVELGAMGGANDVFGVAGFHGLLRLQTCRGMLPDGAIEVPGPDWDELNALPSSWLLDIECPDR